MTKAGDFKVCKAKLPFVYDGRNYFVAGRYEVKLKGSNNQDSGYYFFLSVVDNPRMTKRIGACENVLPTQGVKYNGKTYYKPGAYVDTVRAKNTGDCDTIVTVMVDSYTTYKDTIRKTYCYGEKVDGTTYNWTGTRLIKTENPKTHACQCDSIVYTYVTVNPTYKKDTTVTVCENALPFYWARADKNLFSTKDDTVRFFTRNGCDSIFIISLSVIHSPSRSVDTIVCPDDLKKGFKYGNKVFYKADIDNVVFKAKNGCDSIVTITIKEAKTYRTYLNKEVCSNTLPYYFLTENGMHTHYATGLDTAHFPALNGHGCDSIIYLKLTVITAPQQVEIKDDICDKDLPYRFAGKEFFDNVIDYKFNYPTEKGCDSIINLNVTVNQSYVIDTNITICSDMLPFVFQGDTMNENGIYILKYKTVNACDSIIRVHLTIHNTSKEAVEVTVCENLFPYTFAGQSFPDEGYFTVNLKTIHGCDSIIALHIHKRLIPAKPAGIFGPTKIGKEGVYVFYINQVDSFYPITKYEWTVPDGCTIERTNREEDSIWVNIPDYMGLSDGIITVYAYNECGKSLPDTLRIKTYIKCTIRVYPNPVITNGTLTIEFNDMIGKNMLRITDLTGKILHQEEINVTDNHFEFQLPVNNFSSGEYFVRVQTKEMAILKKIVILKEPTATK